MSVKIEEMIYLKEERIYFSIEKKEYDITDYIDQLLQGLKEKR